MKIFTALLLLSASYSLSQDSLSLKLNASAVRINETVSIDGKLDESFWKSIQPITHFIQRDPDEGKYATEKTEVRLAFDDGALYVGARMYDSSPDSIIARLVRRDVDVTSDLFGFFIDPYYDRRSGYYFGVNAAGTLYDGVLYNDDWDDDSWDGVWEGKVDVDSEGWVAEFRIPFSQFRFHKNNMNVWGVNFRRDIARKNEQTFFVYKPKNESGFVSRFADLVGINDINPPGTFEILPYATTRAEYTNPEPNNPFTNGSNYIPGLGVDFKVGIGTNFTLNATINPDFGQVEIDPAVINLGDVETFFSEKRPFFVEGSTIYQFGQGGARNYWGFNWSNPTLFYSRRIGRIPQGSLPSYDYADKPDRTHILGAAKLTGKIEGNWNIGIIQALTSKETARLDNGGIKMRSEVEPYTYYGIIRAQKEINDGRQGIGFMATGTNRFFDDERLRNQINSSAYVFGFDGWTFLDSSKTWVLAGWTGLSHISGNETKILAVQQNSQHYFQRPDARSFSLDSNLTNLTGYAGRFVLNKQKGNFFFNSAFGFISPEFDNNDVGFLWRSDVINMHVGGGYFWTEQTSLYRYLETGGAIFRNYDYDGNITWEGIFHFGSIQFVNYYSLNWNFAYNPETVNNRRTRGGPLTLNPPGYQTHAYLSSDDRKDIVIGGGFFSYKQPSYSYNWELFTDISFHPASNVSITLSPFFAVNNEFSQWVGAYEDETAIHTFGKRYVFAKLDQKTFGSGIRLNWTFTPQLSLQFYAQPLISSGNYSDFKELAEPKTYNFNKYGEGGSTFDEVNGIADPDGDGPARPIEIGNPDFNFKSLRGNAVLRWEYLPGSVLYFVWTQTRTDFESDGMFRFGRSMSRLFNAKADNIFMVKFTYWFNI